MGRFSTFRFTRLLVLLAAVSVMTGVAFAEVRTDKYEYEIGETVYISGDGMEPGETVAVDVQYPDGTFAQHHEVTAGDAGNFADEYVLAEGSPGGIYTVVATGLTSGSSFSTTFDPCTLILSDASVDYSDVVTFSGTLVGDTGACSGGINSKTINIVVDTDGDGSLADEGTFASGTTSASGSPATFSIASPAIGLSPSFATPQGTGVYKMEAQLDGTSLKSTPFSKLTVSKEDTATSYSGATSGDVSTALSLDADVTDEDSSSFIDDVGPPAGDPNLVGTSKLKFELFDTADAAIVGSAVFADIGATGHTTGSPTMTLPSTAGTYFMHTTYLGNDYYNTSSDASHDAITVTAIVVTTPFDTSFHYHLNGGGAQSSSGDTAIVGAGGSYIVHYTVHANQALTGVKAQGGLNPNKGVPTNAYSGPNGTLSGDKYTGSVAGCGTYQIDLSQSRKKVGSPSGNVVIWSIGAMTAGQTCDLEITINALAFNTAGTYNVTGAWSTVANGETHKPYLGPLTVDAV